MHRTLRDLETGTLERVPPFTCTCCKGTFPGTLRDPMCWEEFRDNGQGGHIYKVHEQVDVCQDCCTRMDGFRRGTVEEGRLVIFHRSVTFDVNKQAREYKEEEIKSL